LEAEKGNRAPLREGKESRGGPSSKERWRLLTKIESNAGREARQKKISGNERLPSICLLSVSPNEGGKKEPSRQREKGDTSIGRMSRKRDFPILGKKKQQRIRVQYAKTSEKRRKREELRLYGEGKIAGASTGSGAHQQ